MIQTIEATMTLRGCSLIRKRHVRLDLKSYTKLQSLSMRFFGKDGDGDDVEVLIHNGFLWSSYGGWEFHVTKLKNERVIEK